MAQLFSCEFYEIFKNTFFTKHLRSAASVFLYCRLRKSLGSSIQV